MRLNDKKAIISVVFVLLMTAVLGSALPPAEAAGSSTSRLSFAKERSTIYTPAKVAAARSNIGKYSWARAMKGDAVTKADAYLNKGFNERLNPEALNAIRDAYLYTGKEKYARAGIAVLEHFAERYKALRFPYLGVNEAQFTKSLLYAYDAFFPAIHDSAIRQKVEDNIIVTVEQRAAAIRRGDGSGSYESVLVLAAVVYDKQPATKQWLDDVFQSYLNPLLVNKLDLDGIAASLTPTENDQQLKNVLEIANILTDYDRYPSRQLFDHVKFRNMLWSGIDRIQSQIYGWLNAESGIPGDTDAYLTLPDLLTLVERYGDPSHALLAHYWNKYEMSGIHGDIFSSNPDFIINEMNRSIIVYAPVVAQNVNKTGSGFTSLRDGPYATDWQRDLWFEYGGAGGRNKAAFQMGLHAFGIDLTPKSQSSGSVMDDGKEQWLSSLIANNTVLVDRSLPNHKQTAIPKHYDAGKWVQLIDVEAPDAFAQAKQYKRTTAMIRVDAATSYAIDFFRVSGGNDHHYVFHSAEGTAKKEGFDKAAGIASVDWDIADKLFPYPSIGDLHLRLTMVGQLDGLSLAKDANNLTYMMARRSGKNLESVFTSVIEPYNTARYISSIAPVEVSLGGKSDSRVSAVKVELVGGRTDYIVSSLNPNDTYTIDKKIQFKGSFGVYSELNGSPMLGYVNDGTLIGKADQPIIQSEWGNVEGSITDFTRSLSLRNKLKVEMDLKGMNPKKLLHSHIYVQNDGKQNAVYEIQAISDLGGNEYELHIGETTTIRSYLDVQNQAKGYVYNIAPGQRFHIPLAFFKLN